MPDLGRGGEVGDEKRSDSLDDFPRVVEARGKREKGASWKEMNLGLIEEHQAGSFGVRAIQLLIHLARGHIGLCYRTNSQSTANLVQ